MITYTCIMQAAQPKGVQVGARIYFG